jgi:hypothetical protein
METVRFSETLAFADESAQLLHHITTFLSQEKPQISRNLKAVPVFAETQTVTFVFATWI